MTHRPFWADLHNHNEIGYGQGSMQRSYRIARGSLLDVFCFTPHGRWHDLPANDPKMAQFHRVGLERVRQHWRQIQAAADAHYQPGRFVTLHGFEWHSSRFGDFHVLLPGPADELFTGETADALKDYCRRHGAMMIPHHVAYQAGWRGADWAGFDAALSPVVEIFSEHGCSMEAEFNAPMLAHSMGGVERSQTMLEKLGRGVSAGVVGSTDNHFGHPASYGEGLTGLWAEALTRESVLEAIRRRHTYAVTGDRIGVRFHLADALMGDAVEPAGACELAWHVDALGPVDYVRILKNGLAVHDAAASDDSGGADYDFVVRLTFGWDAMTSREVTDWRIALSVSGGRIVEVAPGFAGGAGSVEKLNGVTSSRPERVELVAFTSRLNSRPVSEIALRLAGDAGTAVRIEAEAAWKGGRHGCELSASAGQLLERDQWGAISEVFSAPKLRLGQAHPVGQVRRAGVWTDPRPRPGDWYLLKVLQSNGQAAWTSPIWRGRS